MDYKDIFLTPFYLGLVFWLLYLIKPKVTNSLNAKYFIPAVSLKIFCSISLGIIYQFYYNGGDTFNYYQAALGINQAFQQSFSVGLQLLFFDLKSLYYRPEAYYYGIQIWNFSDPATALTIKFVALFSLFSFYTYSIIAIFFSLFSFSGLWALYLTITKIYPRLEKQIAIAVLFIPSVLFWGSGLLKDSLAIGCMGWIFFSFYQIFIIKKKFQLYVPVLLATMYFLSVIKIYILLCFLPPAIFWIFQMNSNRIQHPFVKFMIKPFILGLGMFLAFYSVTNLTKGDEKYDLARIPGRTKITAEYIYSESVKVKGSSYYLGDLDGSFASMLVLAPKAIFVSLYRPFVWEAKNLFMLLSALESTFLLLFSLRILFKIGIMKFFKYIFSSPLLIFCFIFSITFAFSVGITSYNFGTLVRYKIPLLPFYASMLFILESMSGKRSP